jgi:hypothetical protein
MAPTPVTAAPIAADGDARAVIPIIAVTIVRVVEATIWVAYGAGRGTIITRADA